MINATWNGHTMSFASAEEAQEWLEALENAAEQDYDAAARIAYAGDQWRAEVAK